jgi:glycosyltransferase involved in cell wall biosynthesis
MRIGIDARMYRSSVAGIGRYSQSLIKNLLEVDSKNEYVLFMKPEDEKEFRIKNKEESIKNYKIVVTDIHHYSIAEQTKFPKIIEKEKLDLMHFLNFNYPIRYRGKFIVTIHDLTLLFFPDTAKQTNLVKRSAYKFAMKKACQNASKVIAVSENTKNDIMKAFKTPSNKIEVIYEAADDINSELRIENLELRREDKISKPIILYVGQYRVHKNIKGLLRAYKILKKEIDCQLVLVGNVPEEYRNLIDKGPDLRDIIMPGFVSDKELAAWYKTASVFVFPSFYEGFGLPGLEAMIMETPVVASKSSALPEIYKDAAIYFDPGNSQDIADKIKLVLTNNKINKDLVQKGREVVKLYSWKKTALETLKVYQEV